LNHRNILVCYGYGMFEKKPYMAMEYLESTSLHQLLTERHALPAKLSIDIISQVCAAVDYAHRNEIVHRDLKPDNILLVAQTSSYNSEFEVKVIDFGLAKLVRPANGSQALTEAGSTVGTAQYMSPEQCTAMPIDHRSDVYSLGCILYHCLSGSPPFVADQA